MQGATGSTVTADLQAIRIGIYSGASVSYPSNGTVEVYLARPGTNGTGGTSVTPSPHNASDIAANSTWTIGSWTISPARGSGAVLWQQSLPFTAGANWAEYVTPGDEWRLSASGYIGIFVLCSSAGTATQFEAQLVFAE